MQRVEMSDRQAQIVDTAMRLLAAQGARRFTVARLAAEIGVTGGAIYRHFESMETIVGAVIERIGRILFEGVPSDNADPLERLKVFFFHRIRTILANPHLSRLLLSDHLGQASSPAQAKRLESFKRRSREFVMDCLREAQRTGVLADEVDTEAGAILVLGSILTFAHANSRIPSEARAAELTERLWTMIDHALQGMGPVSAPDNRKKRPRCRPTRKER